MVPKVTYCVTSMGQLHVNGRDSQQRLRGGRDSNLAWVHKGRACTPVRHDGGGTGTPEKPPQSAQVAQSPPQPQVEEAGRGDQVKYEVDGGKYEEEVSVADGL